MFSKHVKLVHLKKEKHFVDEMNSVISIKIKPCPAVLTNFISGVRTIGGPRLGPGEH